MQTNFSNLLLYCKCFVKENRRMFQVNFVVGGVVVGVVARVLQIVQDVQSPVLFNNTENFNMEKMLGQWYVVRTSARTRTDPCHLVYFHKDKSNKFSIHVCRGDEWDFICSNATDLKISNEISGVRSLYNNTLFVHYNFSIPETDYDNYAVLHLHKGYSESNSFGILSRTKVLDAGQLEKLTTKYIGTGITWTNSNDDCSKHNATATRIYDT